MRELQSCPTWRAYVTSAESKRRRCCLLQAQLWQAWIPIARDAAWDAIAANRDAEISSGRATEVPLDEALPKLRAGFNEKISSPELRGRSAMFFRGLIKISTTAPFIAFIDCKRISCLFAARLCNGEKCCASVLTFKLRWTSLEQMNG